ncbi:hypothetical protein VP01_426g5 [Puccinia sorghi]|uniref:DUF7143 domain-containing protein n=1 Tax=Puccinia sorghi TaxID=27349 RepID=A0A0L6UQB8_9BASI|nr:hypothetical protein VP01_426g5 [Puccinia sorghi]
MPNSGGSIQYHTIDASNVQVAYVLPCKKSRSDAPPSPQPPQPHEEPQKRETGLKLAQSDEDSVFNPKPCFIMGNFLQILFSPNFLHFLYLFDSLLDFLTCIKAGIRVIPPIPELTFKGINYSDIHYRPNIVTTPVMSAFEIFTINSRNKVPEQIEFLFNSRELYISMEVAIRSLGNQLPRAADHVRDHRMVAKVLDFQLARLEGRIAEIEKALGEMLRFCANCSVKEKFDIIMRAAESGIIVDRFLDDLDRVGCLTKEQCDEEKKKAEDERKAAEKKKEEEKKKLGHWVPYRHQFCVEAPHQTEKGQVKEAG